ncbi:MAG: class I SAM-dependent methyltransferase [Spirochaetia bacterium]|nr:class I SAM-dependent methyltransferase [Spirochaetia bacterium]
MKIPRDITLLIHFFFDECVPPFIRDRKWFMYLPMKILFGNKANLILNFKDKFNETGDDEIVNLYKELHDVGIMQRDTDINTKCLKKLETSIAGKTVLDIACGRAYLCDKLSKDYTVTGADFVIDSSVKKKYPQIKFYDADITRLPFKNKQFDTVICAHTLEHVRDIHQAVRELRRVTKKRLIIIIPMQRPYKYTFDPHVHFFPYRHSFLQFMGKNGLNQECSNVGGDLFYIEDL